MRAADIAAKFFEQYHSEVIVKKVRLDDNTWVIDVTLGLMSRQERQVKIDANTGSILGYQ